ncbi:DUF1254 domain-containing protein [Nocardioides sp. GY 10113]|uniref:DUF1254 domain-containing protein n=1 Tax=Nocardioides sp. GY 10113 TaxID=2569761 RepID=UPI0019825402|nr:DUF1254 domain-containing protein [Nocardioides sp. GY 10113]
MAPASPQLERIAVEGYHYLYPAVLMDVTRRVATSLPAGVRPGFGPPNAFSHMRTFPPGDFRDVVRPNFDTLYSIAWLDLTNGPQVVCVDRAVEQYFMLPMLDMWTDVFAVVGSRTTGGAPAQYAIVPPRWDGSVPEGTVRIDAPTPWVWIVGRTQTNGPADYDAVHAIQDGFALRPLTEQPEATVGAVAPEGGVDLSVAPMDHVASMTGREFFARGARLLSENPPHLTDQPILARLRRLGLEPGRAFDAGTASPEVLAAIDAAPSEALSRMAAAVPVSAPVVDGWAVRRAGIGVYGTDYLYRAVIAMVGLGANLPEDAIYPLLLADENGEPPVGERNYLLHFDADAHPPVDAFWSLTMYDGDGFPVPNAMDRYALGDRDPLVHNPDGSLDLYISRTDPGPERRANWLPAPEGPLGLTFRLYGPRPEILDGRWTPPPLRRA